VADRSWLDQAIAFVSPKAAAQRASWRKALDAAHGRRSYEAAKKGRLSGWTASDASASALAEAAAPKLRARCRELARNDAYAARGISVICESAIGGAGLTPQPDTGDDALDTQITEAFKAWCEECDATGDSDFFGVQDLACRTIVEAGDVLIRRRLRRSTDGLSVPLQVQLLEPDHLDAALTRNGGNDVVGGIELDQLDRRQAYHLFRDHPGDSRLRVRGRTLTSTRVPASEIAHAFIKARPGQLLGVPWLSPVILDLVDLKDFEEAALVRAKVEACIGLLVTTPDGGAGPIAPAGFVTDDDDGRVETLHPGMVEYLKPGETIESLNPTPTNGYDAFTRARLHKIATGIGMPYMLLTGDVSQANFSSYKAGLVPFKQMIRRFQKRVLLPMVCRPLWRWFIDAAEAAGRIDRAEYGVRWTLPGFESIDRQKEALGELQEIRMGKTSLQEVIRQGGGSFDRVMAEWAAFAAHVDGKELVFDSDPRRVTRAGVGQPSDPRAQREDGGEAPQSGGE